MSAFRKKMVVSVLLACFVCLSGNAADYSSSNGEGKSEKSVWTKVLRSVALWLPNRMLDLADCVTLEVGCGANAKLNLVLTRYCVFGAGYGTNGMIGWETGRQLGGYTQDGWNANFMTVGKEEWSREDVCGTYYPFKFQSSGSFVDSANFNVDGYYNTTGADVRVRDPWEIGVEAGLLYNVKFSIHPVAIADFITGLFFIDIDNDDI